MMSFTRLPQEALSSIKQLTARHCAFRMPRLNGQPQANVVEIDIALAQNLASGITNSHTLTTGAASTFVLLRNHS